MVDVFNVETVISCLTASIWLLCILIVHLNRYLPNGPHNSNIEKKNMFYNNVLFLLIRRVEYPMPENRSNSGINKFSYGHTALKPYFSLLFIE